jgi:hypothetical protein
MRRKKYLVAITDLDALTALKRDDERPEPFLPPEALICSLVIALWIPVTGISNSLLDRVDSAMRSEITHRDQRSEVSQQHAHDGC